MRRTLLILMAVMLTAVVRAQFRYHIDNVTDYTQVSTSGNGQRRVGTRASAPLPCTGKPKIPIILVQFADKAFISDTLLDKTIEHSDANVNAFYNKYCNGSDDPDEDYRYTIGSVGTVKGYFMNQSDDQFQPDFVVIGPVTLANGYAYYGKDNSDYSKDVNLTTFYTEAIQGATALGTDWTQFDSNNDGVTDFAFFIFAGEGQNSYGTISSDSEHSSLIWPQERSSTSTVGGVKFGGYGCTNELYMPNHTTKILYPDGIGTMCHELSHGLGLPDLYDTQYVAFGLDYYDVMDSGNYSQIGRSPVEYSSYERDFMGWREIKTIDITESQTITLDPIEKGGYGYKIVNPENQNEYFLLDNRQNIDFDYYYGYVSNYYKNLYGANKGLIVYHIDYSQSRWTSNSVNTNSSHQCFTILPADGALVSSIYGYTTDYFNSMIGDLYPGSQNVTSISASRLSCWTGNCIPVNISIQQNDDLTITISTTPLAKGDINGDGYVNIVDVTALIKILQGDATDTYRNADLTGDGSVTTADVDALVNSILGNE